MNESSPSDFSTSDFTVDSDNGKLIQENSKLNKINKELTNQLSNLKKQFDQAISVNQSIESVFAQKSDMMKQIASLQSEKDDLSRRLKISLQSNADLNAQIASFQSSQKVLLNSSGSSEIAEVSKLKSQILELQENYQKEKTLNDQNTQDLKQLLNASSKYFQEPINSIQDLLRVLAFINKPPLQLIDELTFQNKKNKKQIQLLQDKYKTQSEELAATLQEKENLQSKFDSNISNLSARLDEISNQLDQQNVLNRRLTESNEVLMKENADLHSKETFLSTQSTQKISDNQQILNQLSDKTDQLNKALQMQEKLKAKLLQVASHAKSMEQKIACLQKHLRENESKKTSYKLQIKQLEMHKKQYDSRILETETILNNNQKEMTQIRRELERTKNTVNDNIAEIETYKRDIQQLKQEKETLANQHQKDKVNLDSIQTKLNGADIQVQELQKKLQAAYQPIDSIQLFPISSWSISELPKELGGLIEDIVKNPSLQPPTKLKHVMSTITKWYNSSQEKIEKENQSLNLLHESSKRSITEFILFLKSLFFETNINFDTIISEKSSQEAFRQYIEALRSTVRSANFQKEANDKLVLDTILAVEGKTFDDVLPAIKVMKEEINRLNEYASSSQIQLQKIKKFEKRVSLLQEQASSIEHQNQELQLANIALQKQNSTLQKDYTNEKEMTVSLNETVSQMEDNFQDIQKQLSKKETQISSLKRDIQNMEIEYKGKLKKEKEDSQTRYDQILNEMKNQNNEATNVINDLKIKLSQAESANRELINKVSELNLLNRKAETKINIISSEASRERKSLESQTNAKIMASQAEFKTKFDEMKFSLQSSKQYLVDLISQHLSTFIPPGTVIDEGNLSIVLQTLKRKFEQMQQQDIKIHNLLGQTHYRSLEELLLELSNSSLSKSKK